MESWNETKVLSPREHEVLAVLREGKSAKETANVLGVSEFTVRAHIRNIKYKLSIGRWGWAMFNQSGQGPTAQGEKPE